MACTTGSATSTCPEVMVPWSSTQRSCPYASQRKNRPCAETTCSLLGMRCRSDGKRETLSKKEPCKHLDIFWHRHHWLKICYNYLTPMAAPKNVIIFWHLLSPSDCFCRLQNIYAQAGMSGPQFVEPYMSPPKTAASSTRASPVKHQREPIIHIGDPHDIALKVGGDAPSALYKLDYCEIISICWTFN